MPLRSTGATLRALTTPGMLLLHLAGVLAVALTVALGWWQVQAWQEQRQDRAAELVDAAPVPLAEVLGPDDPFPADGLGRPVEAEGRWLTEAAFEVTDRGHEGRDGRWLVVPLRLCAGSTCDAGSAVPVVLGWWDGAAPAPDPPTGTAAVVGWLQPGEGSAGLDPDPTDAVLPALRIADVQQRVSADLVSGYLIADRERSSVSVEGTEPVTPASLPDPPTFTALRNLLYGLEWWVFGLFAAYLWWRWSRDQLRVAEGEPQDPTAPEASVPSEP